VANFARLASEFEILADKLAEIPLEELRPYRAAAE
jgi:N-formylglutamate deformylase